MALKKPWQDYDPATAPRVPATLGVYELGDASGNILYIGFAGGKSQFGLRGEIQARLNKDSVAGAPASKFRYEVNMMYLTRFVELLEKQQDAAGALPPGNMVPGEYIPKVVRQRAARLKATKTEGSLN